MSGLDDWIVAFAAVDTEDSGGNKYTAAQARDLIDKAVETFDPKFHEPPITIGHPKDNYPAFGWIGSLKSEKRMVRGPGDTDILTDVLLVKPRSVLPEFREMFEREMFKKRSAAFYPDGRFRHLAFLGAAPPAVKGLEDVAFEDIETAIKFEFEESDMSDVKTEGTNGKNSAMPPSTATFSEADVKRMIDEAVNAEKTKLETAIETMKRESREKENALFCEGLKREGKLIPAWEKLGVLQFMHRLDAGQTFEFAEGKPQQSQVEWFKTFLSELPKVVEFAEFATKGKDIGSGSAGDKLDTMTKKKMKEEKMDYKSAFAEVQKENPDLADQYDQEMQAARGRK